MKRGKSPGRKPVKVLKEGVREGTYLLTSSMGAKTNADGGLGD
jgi:hypothetical protein